jgi:hypothetical protein
VKLFPAVTDEDRTAFRMIHRESGTPIKYQKGIETERGFKGVPKDEIVKGYEYAKGHYVLIKPKEIDELKMEAKHPSTSPASSIKTRSATRFAPAWARRRRDRSRLPANQRRRGLAAQHIDGTIKREYRPAFHT